MPGFSSTLQAGLQILKNDGVKRTTREGLFFLNELSQRTIHRKTGRASTGENIYSRDWDVLVILDACRTDLMREVIKERRNDYQFFQEASLDSFYSLASYSKGWMERNFTQDKADEMKNTLHVTGNPFSDSCLNETDFARLDEVWKTGWDDTAGVVPPRPVTDAAISRWRDNSNDDMQMIVHYMQPHIPFLNFDMSKTTSLNPEAWGEATGDDGPDKDIWMQLRDDELSYETVWNAYRENLELVLDDVEILLNNLDAESVVLSADHGNALGERGIWGHPRGIAIDSLREVPWVETTGVDSEEYEPEFSAQSSEGTEELGADEVTERLEHLGYT
jgi:hypothetical protein